MAKGGISGESLGSEPEEARGSRHMADCRTGHRKGDQRKKAKERDDNSKSKSCWICEGKGCETTKFDALS